MALHLNLYHEVLKAKALKRRDPLKISISACRHRGAACACWYFVQLVRMHSVDDELAKVKAEFDKVEPKAKAAKKREEELNAQIAARAQLDGKAHRGPLLLGADARARSRRSCRAKCRSPAWPATSPAKACGAALITIDGLSAGTDPRRVAEELRTAIAEKFSPKYKNVTSTFKTLEDGTETGDARWQADAHRDLRHQRPALHR